MASGSAFVAPLDPPTQALESVPADARREIAKRLFTALHEVGTPLEKLGASEAHGWPSTRCPTSSARAIRSRSTSWSVLRALLDFAKHERKLAPCARASHCSRARGGAPSGPRASHHHEDERRPRNPTCARPRRWDATIRARADRGRSSRSATGRRALRQRGGPQHEVSLALRVRYPVSRRLGCQAALQRRRTLRPPSDGRSGSLGRGADPSAR